MYMCLINSEDIFCNVFNIFMMMKFVENNIKSIQFIQFIVNLYNYDFFCYLVVNNVLSVYVYFKFLYFGGVL